MKWLSFWTFQTCEDIVLLIETETENKAMLLRGEEVDWIAVGGNLEEVPRMLNLNSVWWKMESWHLEKIPKHPQQVYQLLLEIYFLGQQMFKDFDHIQIFDFILCGESL